MIFSLVANFGDHPLVYPKRILGQQMDYVRARGIRLEFEKSNHLRRNSSTVWTEFSQYQNHQFLTDKLGLLASAANQNILLTKTCYCLQLYRMQFIFKFSQKLHNIVHSNTVPIHYKIFEIVFR